MDACFGRFCLTAGIKALQAMMAADFEDLCGKRHACSPKHRGYRWGRTQDAVGYHGGNVDIVRPRLRGSDGDGSLAYRCRDARDLTRRAVAGHKH